MKLKDTRLNAVAVITAPLRFTEPQPDWIQAKASGVVPDELFMLYKATSYLSFDAAPKFLDDPDNLLFSYLCMLLRGIKQQLSDSAELLDNLREANDQIYDPMKKAKGLPWNPMADRLSRRLFQELISVAYSSLDITAEVIALMFTSRIPGLHVGRAQFVSLEDWLRKPAPSTRLVETPQDVGLATLRAAMTPLILPVGPERDWIRLVRMLRNKGAHLGDDVFRYFGLRGSDYRLYLFIPREWPHFFEQHMSPAGANVRESVADLLTRTLIHDDYISFSEGLNAKVHKVVAAACEVLIPVYSTFSAFDLNEPALKELRKNSCSFEFTHFEV